MASVAGEVSTRSVEGRNLMATLNLNRQTTDLYNPPADAVRIVTVPPLTYLMIDGHGDPNMEQEFADAVAALYAVAYTAKSMLKKGEPALDHPVMPLEGLWWADDMTDFRTGNKADWHWTMMIMQPEAVTPAIFAAAREQTMMKKKLPAIADIRLERFDEGLCAQIMHCGHYEVEGPTITHLHAFIAEHGYVRAGKHHEIYLSDPRRNRPERLRTIVRQPIRRA
jgi:hypothetical protein